MLWLNKSEQIEKEPWLAGNMFTLADINFYSMCGMMVEKMFPEMEIAQRCPHLVDWRERMNARPGVIAALEMPDRAASGLRTLPDM